MRGIANSRKSSNQKLEHFKNKQDSVRRSSALSAAKLIMPAISAPKMERRVIKPDP